MPPPVRGPPRSAAARARRRRCADPPDPSAPGRRGRRAAGNGADRRGRSATALAAGAVRTGGPSSRRSRRTLGTAQGGPAAPGPGSPRGGPGAEDDARRPRGEHQGAVRRAEAGIADRPCGQRGVESAHRRGQLVRGAVPDLRQVSRNRPAPAGRTPFLTPSRGPAPAHRPGDGLSGGRKAHRRRVPHPAGRRPDAHTPHDGRARPRLGRVHRRHVGRPARRQPAAARPAGGAPDP